MTTLSAAEQALQDGDPAAAIKLLQEQVRSKPADAKLRIFLFQLLCVQGQWDRALNQLTVAAEMDAAALPMAQAYRETIQCERLREEVFLGRKAPLLFGEPETWIALLIESLLREGRGEHADAAKLRSRLSKRPPRRRAHSTANPSSGSPTPTCASARCSRRWSTASTTGSLSTASRR